MNKEILNKIQDEQDYPVRVTFDVVCDSNTSMGEGESIKERILDYVNQCADAMDDSMRHWGDHEHCIEPVSIKLYTAIESGEDDEGIELINDLDPYWNNEAEQYDINKIESI